MPIIKPCSFPSCKQPRTHGTRCKKHKHTKKDPQPNRPPKVQLKPDYQYDSNGHYVYTTTRWVNLRNHKLAQSPLCEICLTNGVTTAALDIDHIIELKDGGDPYPKLEGLQALCRSCHVTKTKREARERDPKPNLSGVESKNSTIVTDVTKHYR